MNLEDNLEDNFFFFFLIVFIISYFNLLFVFIGLQHSASILLPLVCFQEILQDQDNVDLLKGTHFS
jgi:hypothetical protein